MEHCDGVMINGMWGEVVESSINPVLKVFPSSPPHILSSFGHYLCAENLVEDPRPMGDGKTTISSSRNDCMEQGISAELSQVWHKQEIELCCIKPVRFGGCSLYKLAYPNILSIVAENRYSLYPCSTDFRGAWNTQNTLLVLNSRLWKCISNEPRSSLITMPN